MAGGPGATGGFQSGYGDRMTGGISLNNQGMMANRPQHTQIGDIRSLNDD